MRQFSLIFLLVIGVITTFAVDKNNFKNCDQASFCKRSRNVQYESSPFEVNIDTLIVNPNSIDVDLTNKLNGQIFVLKLEGTKSNTFHFEIDEKSPLKPRYRVVDALKGKPIYEVIKVTSTGSEITVTCGENKALIYAAPFKIEFYQNDVLSISANSKAKMYFEHLRRKQEVPPPPENENEQNENDAPAPEQNNQDEPGTWEENFKSHHDTKPNGPSAVALDFTYHQANVLFGIPEHADSFALKTTVGNGDPYRLYNLDVFEYELNSGMALYGSVPVVYGHGQKSTSGVYWQNAAETWVDIAGTTNEQNVMESIVNFVAGSRQQDAPSAHFISESGIIDVFVLLGPSPKDVFKQYTALTGSGNLPQIFAIGYHQCRWNYNDEQDVMQVAHKFDEHDIPMDTMWLDIEYTDGKKYFTWDHQKFPNAVEMMKNLTNMGRHLTFIIDPHIKRDSGYFLHNECTDRGYYVKNKDGKDYDGWCWPGSSGYIDFFDPEIRKFYADQYLLENFKENSKESGIWNDMNEPSVFNGPEITMPKDNLHYGGWEHRDVHNLYGHMMLSGTYDGLLRRGENELRPFILTRAHFSGTQRYAAVWTGDNTAEWGHLEASIPMCLSLSVAGISFCGADVGGFFGNPETELLYRWYQTGSYIPFFRAHAHIDTKRREPWLYPEDVKLIIRDAIRKRYSFLPFWYTMFYEHERSGLPIMRPLLTQYPLDKNTYGIDNQFMLSDKLLIHPVMQKGVTKVDVYFPSRNGDKQADIWYDIDDYRKIERVGVESVPVDPYKVPVYQRGGTIVPRKMRIRRSAVLMENDPITLVVAVDSDKHAKGTLYIDDEKSFAYRQGKYLYLEFEFKDGVLSSQLIDETASFTTKVWLERVIIVGLDKVPSSATVRASNNQATQVDIIDASKTAFTIRKPGVSLMEPTWSITLNY